MATAKRIGLLAGAAALALTVAACERYEGHEGNAAAAKVDTGAVKDAIAADEKKWNDEFHAKNRDALLAHYGSDPYAVFPGAPAMNGADQLRKGYEGALKDPNFDVSFSSDKVDVSGDLAYSRGRFTEKETDPATKQVKSNSGSYITVYKKQPDGSWKVVEDFTAVEPAAAPAAR